jgi:hypothetical protein
MKQNQGMWATSVSRPRASDEHPNIRNPKPMSEDESQFRLMWADQNGWPQFTNDERSKQYIQRVQSQIVK